MLWLVLCKRFVRALKQNILLQLSQKFIPTRIFQKILNQFQARSQVKVSLQVLILRKNADKKNYKENYEKIRPMQRLYLKKMKSSQRARYPLIISAKKCDKFGKKLKNEDAKLKSNKAFV